MSLFLSFDIGHSSIGWSVLSRSRSLGENPEILGCGSVIFPADDCLASKRRDYRRTRRNIRAARQRIFRMKRLLSHLRVLTEEQLDAPGYAAPHVLAARALQSENSSLSWEELWHVLRWYAHNRGYDGNSRWARQKIDDGDTDKEKAAYALMREYGTEGKSMAETICAVLGVDPLKSKISSAKPYKNLNAAFPREIVQQEVRDILNKHVGLLPRLEPDVIKMIVGSEFSDDEHQAWKTIPVPDIILPKRYYGGLLFGQLVPRFDNRIIGGCPISGEKIPNKSTIEFLEYRWAMILANLRVDGHPLSASQRQKLHERMKSVGMMSPTELRKDLEEISGLESNNVEAYFELHPDSKEALVYDPALALYRGHGTGSKNLKPFWDCLPNIVQKRALGRWKKGRLVDLAWFVDQCVTEGGLNELNDVIDEHFSKDQKSKKPKFPTREHFLKTDFAPSGLSGRAPYSRGVMREVVQFVLSTSRHPNEADTGDQKAGPIYRSEKVKAVERDAEIAELTNNHLIRQRLDILLKLVDDILEEYADGDPAAVSDIVVEVASDLQTYSGMTAKEMQTELTKRLSHFKAAVDKLAEDAPHLPVTGSLIRKCRIAMDMGWECPFSKTVLYAHRLNEYVLAHIIPYADRPSMSLDSLVVTEDWVNQVMGKRTAMEFIKEFAEDQRFRSPRSYKNHIAKLKIAKKETHPEDHRRQKNRIKLLLLENFDPKDQTFTDGSLTQTSHLNRLSARQLERRFVDQETNKSTIRIHTIPGQVTSEIRKAWRLLGTLSRACPATIGENGKPKQKTEIRKITHLHHALDAAVLGLTHYYLPGALSGQIENEKGVIWRAMLKRNKSDAERELLLATGMFYSHYKRDKDGSLSLNKDGQKQLEVRLSDLPKEIKENLAARLEERRVVQHVPADQSGAALELNPWRLRHVSGSYAIITQTEGEIVLIEDARIRYERKKRLKEKDLQTRISLMEKCPDDSFSRREASLVRRGLMKVTKERLSKLVGLHAGKLAVNKSVLVVSENYGIALQSEPSIIPFHEVSAELRRLQNRNKGILPQILRNGMLVRVSSWKGREGIWRVSSCQASLKIDLTPVECVSSKAANWREVNLARLLEREALEIIRSSLTGMVR
ncbi:MAG: type II CRISPR RNA-guided endonuclease Cas9 [Verrucomicrobiota bacterium]